MAESDVATKKDIDALRNRVSLISTQLECMRRLQQIAEGLRQLKVNTATARFAREGEEGYMPDQQRPDGDGYFVIPREENQTRSSTLSDFDYIEDTLDELVGHLNSIADDDSDDLYNLSWHVDDFRRIVREEARESDRHSLNKLAMSSLHIRDRFDLLQRVIYAERRERERCHEDESRKIKSKGPEAWVTERKLHGKLPIPE